MLYAIREMLIKTTVRYRTHLSAKRMSKIQNNNNTKCWPDCDATELSLLVGIHNGTAALGNSLAIPYLKKLNILIPYNPTMDSLLFPEWIENLYLHKNLHKSVYSSFVYICQNLRATKMSLWRGMGKQAVVYPYHVILFSDKKKWAIKSWKVMEET